MTWVGSIGGICEGPNLKGVGMASIEQIKLVMERRAQSFETSAAENSYRELAGEVGATIAFLERLIVTKKGSYELPAMQLGLEMLFEGIVQLGAGLSRLAFYSLRSFSELFGFAILISADQLKGRMWMAGMADLHWSEISDVDKGILGHQYVNAFTVKSLTPDLSQVEILKQSYRRCCEYVHSNPVTWVESQKDVIIKEWASQFGSLSSSLSFAFLIRNWDQAMDGEILETVRVMLRDANGSADYQQALREKINE